MDFQNHLKLIKTTIITAWSISLLCFISTLIISMRSPDESVHSILWLDGLGIFALLVGIGVALFYNQWGVRNLLNKLSTKSRELRRSEERYRSLVESAEDFIFTVNASGRFRSLNNFTAVFFGGTPSQFVGKPLSSLFSPEIAQQQLNLIRLVFQFGKSVRDEFMVTTGEHQIWLSANFMPRKNEQGKVISVLCIARDITESKKLENQLVNTEKLASMGTLAAGVAHEVNNPLGIILGFTDLLLEKTDKDSQNYQDLKTIERHSLHCKAVVENLLSFARHGGGVSEYCDINEDIKDIINVVKHSLDMNDIELRLDLASGLPKVKGDSRQMQQVFLNLINNAAAAIKETGVLEVNTSLHANRDKVIVTVSDNGHGIPEEDMDKIFDPFFTTKSEGEGTGLGLFVSHGIIRKYEGSITCESSTVDSSKKSRGTTFTVALKVKS